MHRSRRQCLSAAIQSLAIGLTWGLALATAQAQASAGVSIQWVDGVSFVGDARGLQGRLPSTSSLAAEPEFRQRLSARLVTVLRQLQADRPDLEIVSDRVLAQADDSYMLTFAIDGENVETQQIEDRLNVAYELQALVLVLNLSKDPMRQRVVTSYPVRVSYLDVAAADPSPAQRQEVFDQLLTAPTNGMPDIVAEWGKRAQAIKLREKNAWLQVLPIEFSEAAVANLGASSDQRDAMAQRATSLLEAGLSRAMDVPVIPHSPDRVPNRLMLSFAGGDASQSFKLPEADYSVGFKVRDMRLVSASAQTKSGLVQTGHSYGALFSAQVARSPRDVGGAVEPLVEATLKRVDTVIFTGERRLSTPQQFSKVVASFAHELAANIASPDVAWITRAKSDAEKKTPADIAAGFQKFALKFR